MGQDVVHALDTPAVPYFTGDHGLDALENITIAAGQGVLVAGTVLGLVTGTGLYVAYDDTALDGSQTAVGILYHRVDAGLVADGDDENVLGSMQNQGVVREASLTGIDAAAKADLANHFIFK